MIGVIGEGDDAFAAIDGGGEFAADHFFERRANI